MPTINREVIGNGDIHTVRFVECDKYIPAPTISLKHTVVGLQFLAKYVFLGNHYIIATTIIHHDDYLFFITQID